MAQVCTVMTFADMLNGTGAWYVFVFGIVALFGLLIAIGYVWGSAHKVDDYSFTALCWAMLLGPIAISLITWNWWWMVLYVGIGLIFGLA